jgi:hypothetical protein
VSNIEHCMALPLRRSEEQRWIEGNEDLICRECDRRDASVTIDRHGDMLCAQCRAEMGDDANV